MTSKKKIKFVTDSTCDIPAELIEKWGITVAPCFVNYGDKSYADDGVELVRDQFYRDLPNISPFPTTSAPSPGVAEEKIKQAFEGADHLVIVCVPAKLSATYNALRLGMQDLPQDRVTLIDSGQLSMGIGWQVLLAAETAEETGDVEKVLDVIQKVRAKQRVYAAAASLEFLRRSGRVGAVTAGIGTLLQIKPVLNVWDGDILPLAKVRTMKNLTDKLIELVQAETPLEKLAIMHANNPDGAQEILSRLGDSAPKDTLIVSVAPTIGAHIGPGSLGVATLNKNWRA